MAVGLLASANTIPFSDVVVYTVPAGLTSTIKVFVTNRNNAAITIRLGLGITTDTEITTTNTIEFDVPVPAYGVVERGNIMLGPGEKVIARTNTANVSVAVCGVEG